MNPLSASRPALEPALAAAFESLSASLHRPLLQLSARDVSHGHKSQSISRALMGHPAIPLIQRHRENEPRFIRGGGHVNSSAMRLRDLRGDMQAKT